MKAEINGEGCLTITAENPNEEFALRMWWKQFTGADDVPKLLHPSLKANYLDKNCYAKSLFDPYKPGEGK